MAGRRFRLYIDESGDHTYSDLYDISRRYLGLCGCVLELSYVNETFIPDMEALKREHFSTHDPDEPVILHRNDITNRKGPFRVLRDDGKRERFDNALIDFFSQQQYKVITVVIDKKAHLESHGHLAWHPYHYCLLALLERYCGLLNHLGDRGDIMAESRGGSEDHHLKSAYRSIYHSGSRWRGPDFFQRAVTSKEIKLKKKKSNVAGLQIADLLAHPSKQEILKDTLILTDSDLGDYCRRIIPAIQTKYNRQLYTGRIEGYGKIFLA